MFGDVKPTLVVSKPIRIVFLSLLEPQTPFKTDIKDAANMILLNIYEWSVRSHFLETHWLTEYSEHPHN